MGVSVRVVFAMSLLCAIAASCTRKIDPVPSGLPPVAINLDHLRRLGLDANVGGRAVRVVALYSEAPDYKPKGSPARDGYEGIAAVDDAARAAVVFLRAYEQTGDSAARRDALGLLAFVAAMEQGDGEFVNFIDTRGRPNLNAASSRKSMSFWAARALWAMGEGVRVLGAGDSAMISMRPVLDRTVARLSREVSSGSLIGGSVTATAEALLGLLALQRAEPSPELASVATKTASLLVSLSVGNMQAPPWGVRVERSGESWHAWGARSTQALAAAAVVLNRPDFAVAARREADAAWGRFLLAGQIPSEVAPTGTAKWFSQIAYGVGSVVEGYLALADATGDDRYAVFGGLISGWFLGANPAGVAMYDAKTGRTFDGIDGPIPLKLNKNSGAESTIEALLAIQAVTSRPEAAAYMRFRPVGPLSASLGTVPDRREYAGPDGARIVLKNGASGIEIDRTAAGSRGAQKREPITLTYWPAANPSETKLAVALASQWNTENPDVQVRVQPLPAGRSTEEVLLAAIVARATPDVSSNVSSALLSRLVRAGGVVRLDDRVATSARLNERTSPAMLSSLRLPDGGIYAFPWKTNPEMLMYNVDLFRAAGVGPPHTHSEMLSVMRRLTRDTDGDGRLDRWAFWATLKTTWFERFYDFYPLYLASSGGKTLVTGGKIVFENEAAVAALQLLRRGFDEGVLPRSNFALGRDPFADGTVAMKIIGPWFLKELEEIKTPGLTYDVTPVPGADGTNPRDSYAFADLRSIAIFSTTKHPEEAARFVAYLTSPAADKMLIELASQLPYRRDLSVDPRFSSALKRWPKLATYATYVDRTRDVDLDPDIVEIFDLISEAYEEGAIYGKTPVKQALARAATEARKIVNAR
jgi:multiple sugar transport system substrate-binding protein